ncbi:MAG TPA: hypothetical protein VGD80_10450, partial [Kofleriaceae bacterium]
KVELLIASMNTEARGLVPIAGYPVARTNDEEKLDLALVRLPQSAIEALAPVKRFVRPSELDLGHAMPQGRYYIAGYPLQLTQTDNAAKRITPGTFTKATHLGISGRAHPGISIVLAHGKDSITLSGDGERARAPSLNGISGCGIWRLWANQQFPHLAEWDESWIRLSGIEHGLVEDVIVGTIASHILKLLILTYPMELTITRDGVSFQPS